MSQDTHFLPYQRRWIQDNSPIKVMEKARQIGISWATAYATARRAITASTTQETWITSRDETTARQFLEDTRKALGFYDAAAQRHHRHVLHPQHPPTRNTLTLANNHRIHALSSHPNAQAGKRGDRILDEFALHADPRQLYAIAYPGTTWGGHLAIISTHRGAQNYFNTLIQEARHNGNPKQLSLHRVTLQDALEQGFLQRLQKTLLPDDPRKDMDEATYFDYIRASCPDAATFEQEYLCSPTDYQHTFLDLQHLSACETKIARPPHAAAGPRFAGLDIARHHDLTVLWTLEKIGDIHHTLHVQEFRDTPFHIQEKHLDATLADPHLQRLAIDRTGIGHQFAERATQRYGARRIESVTFTPQHREVLAYTLRTALENRTLRIPDHPHIRADLLSVRRTTTATGTPRLEAPRHHHSHGDRFWALALALHAADAQRRPAPPLTLTTLPRTRTPRSHP